ncbi:MAG: hypothetical protein Q8R48_05280, partial [Candidatus Omnitrophota bacterium]|nr:hypothetical protein [Candidatus Omnitrophota bacterium]
KVQAYDASGAIIKSYTITQPGALGNIITLVDDVPGAMSFTVTPISDEFTKITRNIGVTRRVTWNYVDGATDYELEVFDADSNSIDTIYVKNPIEKQSTVSKTIDITGASKVVIRPKRIIETSRMTVADYRAALKSGNFAKLSAIYGYLGKTKEALIQDIMAAARDSGISFAEQVLGYVGKNSYDTIERDITGAIITRAPPVVKSRITLVGDQDILRFVSGAISGEGQKSSFDKDSNTLNVLINILSSDTTPAENSSALLGALDRAGYGAIPLSDKQLDLLFGLVSKEKWNRFLSSSSTVTIDPAMPQTGYVFSNSTVKFKNFTNAISHYIRLTAGESQNMDSDWYSFASTMLGIAGILDNELLANNVLQGSELSNIKVRDLLVIGALLNRGVIERGAKAHGESAIDTSEKAAKYKQAILDIAKFAGL